MALTRRVRDLDLTCDKAGNRLKRDRMCLANDLGHTLRPIVVSVVLGSLVAMFGCQEKRATAVNIVLPDGYLGFFEIREDRANGVDVPLVDGVRSYHVPNRDRSW